MNAASQVETQFQPERAALWAAAVLVAATYFYFLVYAEFALLALAEPFTTDAGWRLRGLMLCLGVGGLAGSVWGAWRFRVIRLQSQLSWALRGCAVGAALALGGTAWPLLLLAAAVSGAALGVLTVTLVASLRPVVGTRRLGWVIGGGTGAAYALCNVPWIFEAGARPQAILAAVVVAAASVLTPFLVPQEPSVSPESEYSLTGRLRWVVMLTLLVWLDSAAFFVIQHEDGLRAVTWSGALLPVNLVVHLGGALVAGWWLDRGGRVGVVVAAYLLLAAGCALLAGDGPGLLPASLPYAAGVSLYSVVLVYYPARSGRVWLAAWVFGVAGWVGSALGIGMAQDLRAVPPVFVAVAGAVIAVMLVWRGRATRAALVLVGGAVLAGAGGSRAQAADELVERGREVYIAEGCVHCHSQYVRPDTRDVELWGEATRLESALKASPPLFGNRRQGPDLANVGVRLPFADWHRAHLIAPRAFKPGSRMPSYAHLFKGGDVRGEALVAYLVSLGREGER